MTYTNTEKWSLLHQIDQLDTNYFGLTNDHRHIEAERMAEGRNLIEQTVAYDATAACTFLNLLDRRDDAIRCNDQFAYHHVDEGRQPAAFHLPTTSRRPRPGTRRPPLP